LSLTHKVATTGYNKQMAQKFQKRRFVSLFCGGGGFDLGLISKGFTPLAGYDLNEHAVKSYRDNVCPLVNRLDLSQDVIDLSKRPEVVIAGPPCQGFSTAGLRDVEDKRNHLLPRAGELAISLQPRVAVIENVSAAASGEHSRYWDELQELFRAEGYRTNTLRCNAADLGMAQSRRRLLMFAWKTKRDGCFDIKGAGAARLDDILKGVEELPDHLPEPLEKDSRLQLIASRIGPGQKLCNVRGGPRAVHTWHIPEVFGKTTAEECSLLEFIMRIRRQERRRDFGDADPVDIKSIKKEFGVSTEKLIKSLLIKEYLRRVDGYIDLTHTFNGKFRRFRWEDIACTVDTRFGEPQLFLHPNEDRPFTIREAARIQGFPDEYKFSGGKRDAFTLIGNAVPPPMGSFAASIIEGLLN